MNYSTTWYHLDKDNKVLSSWKERACFSAICYKDNFEKTLQYLLYDFSNMKVTQKEAKDYFLFLKTIPEFKKLMPRSSGQMAESMQYKVDLHKFNGTQIFTILTLIRAVVEDPKIVHEVLTFDRKFKYSIPNFGILKACGTIHAQNVGHWITMRVDKSNLTKMFNNNKHWKDPLPCIKTGLGRNLHNSFVFANEGFAIRNIVDKKYLQELRDEKLGVKKKQVPVMEHRTDTLQLQGF